MSAKQWNSFRKADSEDLYDIKASRGETTLGRCLPLACQQAAPFYFFQEFVMTQSYGVAESTFSTPLTGKERQLINQAVQLLESKLFRLEGWITDPSQVPDYLRLKLAGQPNELFGILLLDSANKIIGFETLFTGTVNQSSVFPRLIVQRALACNATALILVHNHPSGFTTPSHSDRVLTKRIQEALALIEITVLDHFVVGKGEPFSFAKAGLL
jgi:DNA repair protein RadC